MNVFLVFPLHGFSFLSTNFPTHSIPFEWAVETIHGSLPTPTPTPTEPEYISMSGSEIASDFFFPFQLNHVDLHLMLRLQNFIEHHALKLPIKIVQI